MEPMGAPGGGAPSAGWYPDPWSQAPRRWWDGTGWTAEVADGDEAEGDREERFGTDGGGTGIGP